MGALLSSAVREAFEVRGVDMAVRLDLLKVGLGCVWRGVRLVLGGLAVSHV